MSGFNSKNMRTWVLLGLLLFPASCTKDARMQTPADVSKTEIPGDTVAADTLMVDEPSPDVPSVADIFMARIAELCSKAFEGFITTNEHPQNEEDPFDGEKLIMHVRECTQNQIKIPFHVGDDHSRTWVLTRTANGLSLQHDHRHKDGSEDVSNMYGGETTSPGTTTRQEFPVDSRSIEMFKREGLNGSFNNTWAIEMIPGQWFLYELSTPEGRLIRAKFDLSTPVETPPDPWGHPPIDKQQTFPSK